MAKLVVLITTHVEKTLALAEAWQKAGAPGVTLVPSHGFRTLQERTRKLELPHFVNLSTILKQVDDTTQMLLSVVEDDVVDVVDALLRATRSVLRDPLTPKTGIGFVIDVERVFGSEP
jgi:orotidine-5'-phosphate decarboxylase